MYILKNTFSHFSGCNYRMFYTYQSLKGAYRSTSDLSDEAKR